MARAKRGPMAHSARHSLRVVAQGYADAGASRVKRSLKGFTASSGSADRDINESNSTIRQRARMLYMSSPIATSAIHTNRTNVVGMGLVPRAKVDAELLGMDEAEAIAWQRAAEREFAIWAEDKRACDATGTNNFYALQQLALTSWLLSGDVLCLRANARRTKLLPYSLRLHLIEADRLVSPTAPSAAGIGKTTVKLPSGNIVHDGVEVDETGAIVAYHIAPAYPQEIPTDFSAMRKPVRIPAYGARSGLPNVIHVFDAERPEQYRGVSYLAPVIESVLQTRRYTESELLAAEVQSFFTAFIKTEADASEMPYAELDEDGSPRVSSDPDEYEMGPAEINVLQPGEDIVFGNPSRPYSGFDPFIHSIATQIGAALEVPVDLLLKEFNSSYSASRAALMEAWKAFRMRRQWFVDDFCRPVWELWLSEAVALGRISAPGFFADPAIHRAYLGCEWIGPSSGQLDPTKEIQAEILAIEQGLTTRQAAATRLNGSDFDANVSRLSYENDRLREAGATPNGGASFGQAEDPQGEDRQDGEGDEP